MRFAFHLFCVCLLTAVFCINLAAQKKDRVEASQKLAADAACQDFKPGRLVAFPKPIYPAEAVAARRGGTVRATVKIDASGSVAEIERIEGAEIFQAAASDAARKTRYKAGESFYFEFQFAKSNENQSGFSD